MICWKVTTAKILVINCFDKSQLSIWQLLNQINSNLLTMFKLWVNKMSEIPVKNHAKKPQEVLKDAGPNSCEITRK